MSNEFYCVRFDSGIDEYFKNKDNAYACLWQKYLNYYGDESEKMRERARQELNDFAFITGIGGIYVLGFED